MTKTLLIIASTILVPHGLIHLMGTVVYLKLGMVEGLSYKTTLLDGRWDLGEGGMKVFGALWAVAAVGFIIAVVALWAAWSWWQPVLIGVTLFSLALTALDWNVAYAGIAVNLVILAALWFEPRIASWVSL